MNLNSVVGENLTNLLFDDNLTVAQLSSKKVEQSTIQQTTTVSVNPLTDDAQPTAFNPTTLLSQSTASLQSVLQNTTPKSDLIGRFTSIELPDTIDFGELGRVELQILNRGSAVAQGPVTIKLWISTDNNIDKNDVLLATKTSTLSLGTRQSTNISIDYSNMTSVVAPGAYRLIAEIDTNNKINEINEKNNVATRLVSAPGTDIILDWNAAALNAIQSSGESGSGMPPTSGTRLLAMLSTAVYDTVNAFTHNSQVYAVDANAPANASLEAAVVGAAHRILTEVLKNYQPAIALLNQQRAFSLREIKDSPANEAAGEQFGRSIADQILALRQNDGSANNAPYVAPPGDYVWQTTPPNNAYVGQNWGKVTSFALPNIDDFAPNGLDGTPTKNPTLYAREIEEVRKKGGRYNTNLTTITRSDDQTQLVYFWAYDRADTFRPYGQLNQIAQEIAVREQSSLEDNARLFAALNTALADSAIVAWKAKYKFTQPRPDQVIAGGIAENDGITSTKSDPNWKPLLDTPPFPDYISGHSTFAGAWAGVMSHFFGDNYQFTAVSQELPGIQRSFDSFYDAAYEDAISRVYGGVHTREATITDALPTGLEIGQYIAQNVFQPVQQG